MLIGSETPINYRDVLCITALIISISLETLADEQQWTYQSTKHSQSKTPPSSISYCKLEDLKRGFITGGLFRYSRHPNFACEQANWYFFYIFGCIATVTLDLFMKGFDMCRRRGGIGLLEDPWRLHLWFLWYEWYERERLADDVRGRQFWLSGLLLRSICMTPAETIEV